MSEETEDLDLPFVPDIKPAIKKTEKKEKAPRAKKRPSDFEIIRTILTRTTERKLSRILRNFGEPDHTLVLCSADESGFTYGSCTMTIAFVQFTDPELQEMAKSVLGRLYGFNSEKQAIINLRDQMSELAKTKGESIDVEIASDAQGSVWTTKKDVNGRERLVYFSQAMDSLFHFDILDVWKTRYLPLLYTQYDGHLYYPYTHPDGLTSEIITLPPGEDPSHPITSVYPNGFRTLVTRGLDVLISKNLKDIPYGLVSEELVVFQPDGVACQIAHRLRGNGWSMVSVRPNAILFPVSSTSLSKVGSHPL